MAETPASTGFENRKPAAPAALDPDSSTGGGERITPTLVTEAVSEVMKASNPGGVVDQALAAQIGGNIRPSLEKVIGGRVASGADLMAMTAFRTILNQYLNSPSSAYVDEQSRKAMQRTLDTANTTGSQYASALARLADARGMDGMGAGRSGERPGSSMGYRELSASAVAEKIGVTSRDFAGLEKQFGHDAVVVAAQQIQDMGLRGKQNLAYAAEYKDVAAALHLGNVEEAKALAAAESDPRKKKGMESFIRNFEAAQAQRLDVATKDMPKAEADEFKKAYRNHQYEPNNPKFQGEFEALKEKYRDDPKLMRELTRFDNDKSKIENTAKREADKNRGRKTENAATKARVEAKTERAIENDKKQDDVLALLNDDKPNASKDTVKSEETKSAASKEARKPSLISKASLPKV